MIVVTGANGFIGSNVVAACRCSGRQEILAVDVLPSIGDRLTPVARVFEARYALPQQGTMWLDMAALPGWLLRRGTMVEAIVHLGALSDTTLTDRQRVMKHNLAYTRTLWEWAAGAGCPLIYASSAATYGDGSLGYSDEADPRQFQPLNLYAESKHQFDLWALEQSRTPSRWAGLKYFNVYGPHEAHKGPMASVAFQAFNQVRSGGRVRLFKSHRDGIADGHQQRDFIHVADAVAATLHFLSTPASSDAPSGLYNVGTGQARTFEDVARAVFAALGRPPAIDYIPMPEHLRERYQYSTQATVTRLRRAGLTHKMATIEEGIHHYVCDFLLKRAA